VSALVLDAAELRKPVRAAVARHSTSLPAFVPVGPI
jgi:hypothetical protein